MRPDSQRALVLQGGGSLGAYEAGVYEVLYEKIIKMDKEKGETVKPLLNTVYPACLSSIRSCSNLLFTDPSSPCLNLIL
jgi:NTE family protein